MPASKDRVTLVMRITHNRFNEQPKGIEIGTSRALGLDGDQPWSRDAKVGEDWLPLELGWCADQKIAYLVIKNIVYASQPRSRSPSPEEVSQERDQWLEVKYEDSQHCFLIPPDEGLPIIPSNAASLRIRVRKGSKKYRIFAIPEPE